MKTTTTKKQLEKLNGLEKLTQEELRDVVGEVVLILGYDRCGEEIKNNRKPRRNAQFFMDSFFNKSNLSELESELRNSFTIAIYLLKANTQNKLNFIKLMNDYSNTCSKYSELSCEMDNLSIEGNTEKWKEGYEESKKLFNEMMNLEYAMIKFVD